MSVLLQYLLIIHVFLGLLGIAAFYAALMVLLKPLNPLKIKLLKIYSLAGFVSFILSWFSGGYYYVIYYGFAVRPLIKAGEYPWIHTVLMETKEHIFLFLPFFALAAAAGIYLFSGNLEQNPRIKKQIAFVCAIITIIGAAIALMGMAISGAAMIEYE